MSDHRVFHEYLLYAPLLPFLFLFFFLFLFLFLFRFLFFLLLLLFVLFLLFLVFVRSALIFSSLHSSSLLAVLFVSCRLTMPSFRVTLCPHYCAPVYPFRMPPSPIAVIQSLRQLCPA